VNPHLSSVQIKELEVGCSGNERQVMDLAVGELQLPQLKFWGLDQGLKVKCRGRGAVQQLDVGQASERRDVGNPCVWVWVGALSVSNGSQRPGRIQGPEIWRLAMRIGNTQPTPRPTCPLHLANSCISYPSPKIGQPAPHIRVLASWTLLSFVHRRSGAKSKTGVSLTTNVLRLEHSPSGATSKTRVRLQCSLSSLGAPRSASRKST
jgi:hypothetical protein